MRMWLVAAAAFLTIGCQPESGGAAQSADAATAQSNVVIPAAAVPAVSSEPREYSDGRGDVVLFPLGDLSFADEVVSFEIGDPRAAESNSQPQAALGPPNYLESDDDTYLSLSCGGVLTLRFIDNALTDGQGPDLYVFEIGPAVEGMTLSISTDGEEWIEAGHISAGRAEVDIHGHARPGEV